MPPFAPSEPVGPYEVLRAFAAGASGVLVAARRREETSGVTVLMKALARPEGGVDARSTILESAAAVDVDGLLPIREVLALEGRTLVVRPFVEGTTLAARAKVEGPMAEADAVALGRRLCETLGAVHAAGLVHGDLRPGHVLFAEGKRLDEALVVDLGCPSPPSATSAPELFGGKAAVPATDVYGLCMTLYVALVGRSPFRADAAEELTWLVRSSPPPPLKVMRPGVEVPSDLERLIAWGLAKDPAARPALSEVAEVLAGVGRGDGPAAAAVLSRAPGPDDSGPRRPPRGSIPPEALGRADESSPTLRVVQKLLPKAILRSTGLTQAFFVEGEEMEREVARAAAEETRAARENALAWVRALALLLIGVSLAVLTIWGLWR